MGLISADMKRVVEATTPWLRRHGLPRRHPESLAQGHDGRLGRRSPRLRQHPLAGHARQPPTEPQRRGQRRRSVRAQGLSLQGCCIRSRLRTCYDEVIAFYKERGVANTIREVVMVRVQSAQPIDSPAYDLGLTEDEVRARWERHWQSVHAGNTSSPTGE